MTRSSDATLTRQPTDVVPRRARALVVVASGDERAIGRELPLDTASVIGRAADGAGRIEDPSVSRTHARVEPDANGALVVDLGGHNGVFVDGRRVDGVGRLRAHEVLALGDTLLVLDEEPASGALPASMRADESAARELEGRALATRALRRSIATVAPTPGAVLLLGPTGTGKEVAAHALHRLSGRGGPLVAVNCAALPAELAEAELFGARKGAFTGADRDRVGFIASSDGGTLFLDELGDLPPTVQAKLLRMLETREVQPLGGGPPRRVDLRVIAATSLDLDAAGFRKDLLARIGDWTLRLPPLAMRKPDVVWLWRHFLGADAARTPTALLEALLIHDWPMNVRELKKLAERVRTLDDGAAPSLALLPAPHQQRWRERRSEKASTDVHVAVAAGDAAAESRDVGSSSSGAGAPSHEQLDAALREARGNLAQVAAEHGWHRTQLYRWIKRYRIDVERYRDPPQ